LKAITFKPMRRITRHVWRSSIFEVQYFNLKTFLGSVAFYLITACSTNEEFILKNMHHLVKRIAF